MILQDELTEPTIEGKLRQLSTFFTDIPFEDIGCNFSLTNDINCDPEYFLEMMAGALTYHFGIEADCDTIRQFSTLGELSSFVESRLS